MDFRKIIALSGSAVALSFGAATIAQAQNTVTAQQKQAYIDAAKASNKREIADDAAFNAHRARLQNDIAAAKRSGNMAQLRKLEAMQAADNQHLQRDDVQDAQNQAHIKRVYALKTKR
jgi:hypothetical protein